MEEEIEKIREIIKRMYWPEDVEKELLAELDRVVKADGKNTFMTDEE